MIEILSAAMMSDVLAKHVDFFSIGTNDLTLSTYNASEIYEFSSNTLLYF